MNKILLSLALLISQPVYTQTFQTERSIIWLPKEVAIKNSGKLSDYSPQQKILYFNQDLPVYDKVHPPVFREVIHAPGHYRDHPIELTDLRFENTGRMDLSSWEKMDELGENISLKQEWSVSRGKPALQISFIPLRKNPATGDIEKLTSFSYKFSDKEESANYDQGTTKRTYAGNSVLSNGTWIMIRTTEDGIYRLSYEEIVEMGIENPSDVRIYGNGNRMLPKMNDKPRPDDLIENKIYMNSGSDGIFNHGDYILFYGQGPLSWDYNEAEGLFEHNRHLYSAGSYYFITSSASGKERINKKQSTDAPPDVYVSNFDDYYVHEKDLVNFLNSGREWFGEHFKMTTTYNFSFNFPNIVTDSEVRLKWRAAARSPVATSFSILYNTSIIDQINFSPVNPGSITSDYAAVNQGTASFSESGDNMDISVNFSQNTASAEGWLDYLLLNVRRSLTMSGSQMHFRDIRSVEQEQVAEFRLKNPKPGTRIWDISDPRNILEINVEQSGNNLVFTDATSRLNQYIAFGETNYLRPEVIERVPNQNLHGINSCDMIIVSHPLFITQARLLANHRRNNDGLEVLVVTPQEIYNEFSSGKPDVAAIRDFVKMLYDRAINESGMPRYLLLFGRGSYDNRPGDPSGNNFIPTYQSPNSLSPIRSFVSDDFFGLLDDNEGEYSGLVDIGIGRIPVSTPDQAQSVVNKIINYNSPGKKGDWQNVLCFIGDDGDNNIHMRDADILAQSVSENYPVYNIEKIYLDAWPKTGTSLGQRYPEVNRAISERIRKGSLLINYTGHGNELRLADENIMDINDAMSWTNKDRLPVFMTATCEFSRFDNPERVSAGEMLLLNPNGGGIALFSTTRLVYARPNFFLNQNFIRFVMERKNNGHDMRLGDVMRLTKISSGAGINKRNFTLLGDPSMKLAIPEHGIIITSVNETPVTEIPDTLKALSKVNIEGRIITDHGTVINDFEGMVYNTVFDKKKQISTLGNDGSTPFNFESRNNIIYKGKSSVHSGEFSFEFIVPKDIAYHYDYGKISSFATDGRTDAAGFMNNVIIGGSNPEPITDTKGPDIELYMNDKNFVSGGMTNQNPVLLAFLRDSSGINTVGSGIGHDITLTVNDNLKGIIVLNDYYTADANSYQSGTIEYPFSELEEGNYKLRLKAWDVFNNSSESSLDFTVAGSDQLTLNNVFNYPNPFTRNTSFHFEHNRPYTGMNVLIRIFTVTGRLVKTIESSINTTGFRPDPISWDGLDDYGDRIGRGVYIYHIRIRTEDGKTAEKYEKLVILK